MSQDYDVPNAHIRMGTLVDYIFTTIPNTTILVAKLPPNGNNATEANVQIFNANLEKMVSSRPRAKLMLADMHAALDVSTDLLPDGLHPNDGGYKEIATVWENTLSWAYLMIGSPNCLRPILGLQDGDGS